MIRRSLLFLVFWSALSAYAQDAASMLEVRSEVVNADEGETRWMDLIRSRVSEWHRAIVPIAALYAPAPPPSRVAIVLVDRNGTDAFTRDPQTIVFDVAALQREYGAATSPENVDRIDRLLRHEYAHLMQKSWLRQNPYEANTHFRTALLDIWLEGLGNYHSMSKPWRAHEGAASQKATDVLAILEPRFCARLAALSCATSENKDRLIADLSFGRFDRKWGGLTLALWVEQEMSISPDAYRTLVLGGPDAIPAMAKRHLPAALAAVFEEAVKQAEMCGGAGPVTHVPR